MPVTIDLESIPSSERWLPIVPKVGLEPHANLRPNLDGGADWQLTLSLGSITSGEAWGTGARMITAWADVGSIVSRESWVSAPGLVPHVGLHPGVGLHPAGSGVSWAWLFSVGSITPNETWGRTDFVSFAARIFSKLSLPSGARKRLRFSA